jgi:ferredoxin-nitrite reductase
MAYDQVWRKDVELLNNVEKIKLDRDGLEVIEAIIKKYSKYGFDSVPEEDRILLKWAGIYEQKPKNGLFMLRVRINTGKINVSGAKVLSEISQKYGRNFMKITTRGAIQFYNIRLEDLPDIFNKLNSVHLASYEACGDCPRTVIGNPLAGIDKNELFDTTELVNKVNDFLLLNRDFSNLPRKLKISISASTKNAGNSEINDISFTPAIKKIEGKEVIGFHLKVGGGLSTKPVIAKEINAFIAVEQVQKVIEAVTTIFRDYGYRNNRNRARLKFLIEDWGIEKFTEKLYEYTGVLPTKGIDKTEDCSYINYYGVNPQKQKGKSYIGVHIPLGQMNSADFNELAQISEEYGDGILRTTSCQNIIISGIKNDKLDEVLSKEIFKKLSYQPKTILSRIVACTGSKFCNLALVDTQSIALKLSKFIDEKLEVDVPINIKISGCPNSCGHTNTADIGIRGSIIKQEGKRYEAFDVFLGGKLGQGATFGQKLDLRLRENELIKAIAKIIEQYLAHRKDNETFHNFISRVDARGFLT